MPSLQGLNKNIQDYSDLCFNIDSSKLSPIYLNGQQITCVDSENNYIATDIYGRNIMNSVCDFYQRSNSIINGFRVCDRHFTLYFMYAYVWM